MSRADKKQVTVLLDPMVEERFSAYCDQRGFKKSTLIVRLIREHLDREGFAAQPNLFETRSELTERHPTRKPTPKPTRRTPRV